tara:strand:+ start:284 stop:685 length:402 start_codon:yes stop_codon:yes gene_type:complete
MFAVKSSGANDKWIAIFNSKFDEFVKDLISLFPNDKDFKLLKNSFNLMKLADDKKPFELFARYSQNFEKQVQAKDERFFLDHDYEDVVTKESNFTEDLVNKLKSYWKVMSEEDKEIIWKYLGLFFGLKNKIYS